MEVLANSYVTDRQTVDENALHELVGLFGCLFPVEGNDDDRVDAGRLEQFEFLVEVGEEQRRGLGSNDRCGVPVERDNHTHRTVGGSFRAHGRDHRLMTEVHSVVCTDRDDGAASGPR